MNRILSILIIVSLCALATGSPAQSDTTPISRKLALQGFENIRVEKQHHKLLLAFENNVYRWDVQAIKCLLDSLVAYPAEIEELTLILLDRDIPQVQIEVSVNDWLKFRKGEYPSADKNNILKVSRPTSNNWSILKKQTPVNSVFSKIDGVIYPQFAIQNRLLTQLYEVQFNLSPAIEMTLWRGMHFTGQVIFPLYNEIEIMDVKENANYRERGFLYTSDENNHIRPGFICLSQNIRLNRRWDTNVSLGNFNAHRYGINVHSNYNFKGDRWSFSCTAGLTGSSHFIDQRWISGKMDQITWNVKAAYYYPAYQLQMEISYGNYLNNDKGFRAECTRHFGETAVSFYAMYTGNRPNGGFRFTIPFSWIKQKRQQFFNIRLAKYFDSDYNAGYAVYYGKEFETQPTNNHNERFYHPAWIKHNLMK